MSISIKSINLKDQLTIDGRKVDVNGIIVRSVNVHQMLTSKKEV